MSALLRFSRVVLACLAVLAAGAPAVASPVVRDEIVQVDRAKPQATAAIGHESEAARPRRSVDAGVPASFPWARRLFILNRSLLR